MTAQPLCVSFRMSQFGLIGMIKIILRAKDYLTGKVLRLLRKNGDDVEQTIGKDEKIHINILNNYHARKEIQAAWLEAETKKAEALTALQRQRPIF